MPEMSPKRSLSPPDANIPDPKRQRVDVVVDADESTAAVNAADAERQDDVRDDDDGLVAIESRVPTQHYAARQGIQRSIALVLKHDGFHSATPEALESFTHLVETYLESIIIETKRSALAARRDNPTPPDFDATLRRYNLPISSLIPHLKPPIPRAEVAPKYVNVCPIDNDAYTTLPLLGEELSGQADKQQKTYIPSNYPDFPSKHTYSFTPQSDPNLRDSKKTREEAARTAQHGEDALRRLVRASKMRKQKEAKSLVERDDQGRERFRLWETTMRRFMGADSRGEQTDEVDIADHSMIVNGDALFSRKEVPRQGKRSALGGSRT